MSSNDFICQSCGEENPEGSTFCIICGTTLGIRSKDQPVARPFSEQDWYLNKKFWNNTKIGSILFCIILILIDLNADQKIGWALWVIIPVLLFTIVKPIIEKLR